MDARLTLAEFGVPLAVWARLYPDCDDCGCPDDRCIGYHHDEGQPCDLRYWIEQDLEEGTLVYGPNNRVRAGRGHDDSH
jgi:hypothetical protein